MRNNSQKIKRGCLKVLKIIMLKLFQNLTLLILNSYKTYISTSLNYLLINEVEAQFEKKLFLDSLLTLNNYYFGACIDFTILYTEISRGSIIFFCHFTFENTLFTTVLCTLSLNKCNRMSVCVYVQGRILLTAEPSNSIIKS